MLYLYVSEMLFQTVLEHPSLPHLTHLIQLTSSLAETLKTEVSQKKVKRVVRKYDASDPRHSQQAAGLNFFNFLAPKTTW